MQCQFNVPLFGINEKGDFQKDFFSFQSIGQQAKGIIIVTRDVLTMTIIIRVCTKATVLA